MAAQSSFEFTSVVGGGCDVIFNITEGGGVRTIFLCFGGGGVLSKFLPDNSSFSAPPPPPPSLLTIIAQSLNNRSLLVSHDQKIVKDFNQLISGEMHIFTICLTIWFRYFDCYEKLF